MADTYIAPTPQRLAKAAHWEEPSDKQVINGREVTKATRSGYRSISVVEVMHRAGELKDEQKQAFERLTKDWEISDPNQYARMAPTRVDQDDSPFCPVARRVDARQRFRNAIDALDLMGGAVLRHCLMPMASKKSVGILVVGPRSMAERHLINRGKKAIQDATMALAIHYDYAKHPPSP